MKTHISTPLCAVLISVVVPSELNAQGRSTGGFAAVNGAAQSAPLTGNNAIEHLKRTGQYQSLSAAITGARYGVKTNPDREHTATAANPAQGLFSTFTPDGLRLEIREAVTSILAP